MEVILFLAVFTIPYVYVITRVVGIAWHTEKMNYQRRFIQNLENHG